MLNQQRIKRPWTLTLLADSAWHRFAEFALGGMSRMSGIPFTRLAESMVISHLSSITEGELKVVTPSGRVYQFPDHVKDSDESYIKDGSDSKLGNQQSSSRPPRAEIRILQEVFWIRLCIFGDLGFSESFMFGEIECSDLTTVFALFLANKENSATAMNTRTAYLVGKLQKILASGVANTLGNAKSNISAHYDISNDMFASFLSDDMTYSCAIYPDLDGDLGDHHTRSDDFLSPPERYNGQSGSFKQPLGPKLNGFASYDALQEAQFRKLDHIIRKAHILPGQRVLEIGSGWGSMATRIAQTVPGVTIDTLTLSLQQQTLARKRISAAGFGPNEETGKDGRIRVHLMDYRSMPDSWKGTFDRVVSVEMLEAVGLEYLETYWRAVDWALKDKDAVGVVQVITLPEARLENYLSEVDFIRQYVVFPGGCLPTVTLLNKSLTTGSEGRLVIDSVSNIGPHYARTLREWRRRFEDTFEAVIVPALQLEHPEVITGPNGREAIETFKRKWISVTAKLDLRNAYLEIISLPLSERVMKGMDAAPTIEIFPVHEEIAYYQSPARLS